MRTILLFLFLPLLSFSQPIYTFIDSSDLIIEGRVISRHEIETKNGWNRVAKVKILTIFEGSYPKETIDILYHDLQFHTKIYFSEKEHFIAFLKISETIAETLSNHNGKFKYTDDLSTFLTTYLLLKSEEDKINILLRYLEKGQEFSVLSQDIYEYRGDLDKISQQKLFDIASINSTQIIKDLPEQITNSYYEQCFKANEYNSLLLTINNKKIKKLAVHFLTQQLTFTSSRIIAENSVGLIGKMSTRNKLNKKLAEYNQNHLYDIDDGDKIDKELAEIIDYLKNTNTHNRYK